MNNGNVNLSKTVGMASNFSIALNTKQASEMLSKMLGTTVCESMVRGAVHRKALTPINPHSRHMSFHISELERWVQSPEFADGLKKSHRRFAYMAAVKNGTYRKATPQPKKDSAKIGPTSGTDRAESMMSPTVMDDTRIVEALTEQNRLLERIAEKLDYLALHQETVLTESTKALSAANAVMTTLAQ